MKLKNNKKTTETNMVLPGQISKQVDFKPISTSETLISKNKQKFKRSGHLVDQILHTNNNTQYKFELFFSSLSESKQQKALENNALTQQSIGIHLTGSQYKLIECISLLLHQKSQIENPEEDNYYAGNLALTKVHFLEETTIVPQLSLTYYEIAKVYKGNEFVSGKDIKNIKNILEELATINFFLDYEEVYFDKVKGKTIVKKIRDYERLIKIRTISNTEYNENEVETKREETVIVTLNQIFRRQMETKYLLIPTDILTRTIDAYGSHNIPEIVLRLRDYLIREFSYKHYKPEISIEKLYYILSEKWVKESRIKKIDDYFNRALITCQKLGLLQEYQIIPNSNGKDKICFTLNSEWE